MGTCKFCGQSAGLFSSVHPECENRYNQGVERIRSIVRSSLSAGNEARSADEISRAAATYRLPQNSVRETVFSAWHEAFEHCLSDGILTLEEESSLANAIRALGISKQCLIDNRVPHRVSMARALRDLMEGRLPVQPQEMIAPATFNFQKTESFVWSFSDVSYYEEKTRRQMVGGYTGASVRVARGVYWKVGGFRGVPIESTATQHIDTGVLAFTTKHLYFGGPRKSFRIPYPKIVSYQPYSDGVTVTRDAASAKPQTFITQDGWFVYNLLANLASAS